MKSLLKKFKSNSSSNKPASKTAKNLGAPVGESIPEIDEATRKRLDALANVKSHHVDSKRARSIQPAMINREKKRKSHLKETEVDDVRRRSMPQNALQQAGLEEPKAKVKAKKTKKSKTSRTQVRLKGEMFEIYDFYEPVKILGSGAYAVVIETIDTRSGRRVAIKKNKGVFDHITDARRILREIKLLMHFDHDDVIPLLGVIPPEPADVETFQDVYLIMPRMETTLAKVIKSSQKLSDRHFQYFIYQMLRGLRYLHSAGTIHRDLKPENLLINGKDCNLKITDFGLARGVCEDEERTQYVVTRWYRGPEVMCSAGQYDSKVDIWSVGCIFAEMLLRKPLFPGKNYLDQLKWIFNICGTPPEDDIDWIKTPDAKQWVQRMKKQPAKDFSTLFPDASTDAVDLIRQLLVLNPFKRADAKSLVAHPYLADLYKNDDEFVKCPLFDLSFEFESSIKTKFGVRHMMYDTLKLFKSEMHKQKRKK